MRSPEQQVANLRVTAKTYRKITDEEIGKVCGKAAGTIRNMASTGKLHTLSFESVQALAALAGGHMEFVEDK